jgi:ubiquinone/menaquinone biosynthesis C-methylase UbiE
MIGYAQSLTRAQNIENLQFTIGNARQMPLPFPDGTFDFINTRLIIGFMFKEDWLKIIAEGMRLLRPGGILRLTESDRAARTTSAAFEEMQDILAQFGYQIGRAFQPSDVGIMIRMPSFLRRTGFQQVGVQAYVIDWSRGTKAWAIMCQDIEMAFKLIQRYAVQAGSTDEQWSALYEQAMRDFHDEDFCAFGHFISAWGQKAI